MPVLFDLSIINTIKAGPLHFRAEQNFTLANRTESGEKAIQLQSGGFMFQRVLVANRGEIAVRIMRTLREMGISPVTVCSEVDQEALHVRMADAALCVGPEPSQESYLQEERIIRAALELGAEAIHPGYGFLSENAGFARAVEAAGLSWIGPPPGAIETMGDKLLARRQVEPAGVPLVPGSPALSDPKEALKIAREIGFPVMVKASAGGGGKGMRLVEREEVFQAALQAAQREAAGAFGDDSVYVERFIQEPHHIEIQVFCDSHGGAVYLGERECSVQRRHQKVVEECPSPFIDEPLRQEMGMVAMRVARACNYLGAGTVEFLVGADHRFYFLEMNTRLQVEHPVTELVYGVDLVEWQLRIAAGEPLPLKQEEIQARGHALECRVYAEDPDNFLPSPGRITALSWPQGPGVRVDAGVDERSTVGMAYDPMIAKLCVWGQDRRRALARMTRALDECVIQGITSNLKLHRRILQLPEFQKGCYDTGILNEALAPLEDEESLRELLIAAAIIKHFQQDRKPEEQSGPECLSSPWLQMGRLKILRRG